MRTDPATSTAAITIAETPTVSSGIEDSNQAAGPSSASSASPTTAVRRRKTKRRKRKTHRTVYRIDEATGETVAVREKIKRRRTKKRRRTTRSRRTMAQQLTVKRRLASQLGICRQRASVQHLPDVRVPGTAGNILHQRHLAGIPTLHLFGQQDEIDYFSESDGEVDGGGGVLISRRPNRNDVSALRNQMRRKMVSVPSAAQATPDDLLGSILESQTKLYSKNAVLSLNADGSLKVDTSDTSERVNLNNNNIVKYRKAPMQPNEANGSDGRNAITSFTSETNSTYGNYTSAVSSATSSVIANASGNSSFEQPHDYSQVTACDAYRGEDQERKDKKSEDNSKNCDSISGDNTPKSTASAHSDSELDIYSDIETVSTSKIEEQDAKASTPVLEPLPSAAAEAAGENHSTRM